MSSDSTRKREDEQARRRRDARLRPTAGYAICMHCSNPFLISDGVVAAEFALCDICNGD